MMTRRVLQKGLDADSPMMIHEEAPGITTTGILSFKMSRDISHDGNVQPLLAKNNLQDAATILNEPENFNGMLLLTV